MCVFVCDSIAQADENAPVCDGPPMEVPGEFESDLKITYTYSVTFEVSHP